jgi:hypothetical protein
MRASQIALRLAGFSLILLSTPAMFSQNAATEMKGGVIGSTANGCSDADALKPVVKPVIVPYTGIRKTTRVQKLANGATITQESTAKEARDSIGKTYRETRPEAPMSSEGQVPSMSFFNVYDPVNRLSISWSSRSKEATVFHMPEPQPVRQAPRSVTLPQPAFVPVRPERGAVENLGTKTINGVEAKGTRYTETFPAGKVGNDQPLTITHEMWMSTELRVQVLQIDDDPRTGVRTVELTEIERGEPDPALFQPPEGYTVKDQFPNQQN